MFCEVHAASIADSSASGKALATKFREEPENWINSIHRESLNGETAYAYDSRMAQVG